MSGRTEHGKWIRSAWQWLQRAWWHWSERWPVSSVVAFVKALPLLALWLLMAFAVFYRLLLPLMGPGKETFTLLAALVTALVGFGVQQWKSLTEEERSRRQKQREAMKEIDGLETLLRSDPSEGARHYMELKARGGVVWKSGRVQAALEQAWSTTAPIELQHTVDLLSCLEGSERYQFTGVSPYYNRFFKAAKSIGPKRSADALLWARENLDDDWRQKAFDGIQRLDQHPEYRQHIPRKVLRDTEQSPWRAILRPWPHVSLWRGFPPAADAELAEGLRYLGLESNPFGSGKAETDTLLLTCRVNPCWLEELHKPQPALLGGASGSGKTATALLLAYDSLRGQDAFPVYYPATPGTFKFDEIAQVMAKTLLHYLAVTPTGFLKRGVAGKAAIAHLLARYACPNLALRFHRAGLPLAGDGAKMLQEVETLIQGSSFQEPLSDDGLLALLSEAYPRGFRYTTILLDVQEQTDEGKAAPSDACLRSLFGLSDALARSGVFVKAFLPDTFWESGGQQSNQQPRALQWSDTDLRRLLGSRLARFGDDTLAAWCDPREGDLSPDSHLVSAAHGTPGGLSNKGNELLRRTGQRQRRLTAQDLDEILGPLPAQSDEAES